MSIILKGIGMPSKNGHFELFTSPDGKWRILTRDGAVDVEAIEIPTPHGRLIDGDWFIKQMKEYNPQTSKTKWAEIVAELAPIFLEAEE